MQVNGKVRARVTVATGASEADARGRGAGRRPRSPSCSTARRSARSSSCPAAWSTSSSADRRTSSAATAPSAAYGTLVPSPTAPPRALPPVFRRAPARRARRSARGRASRHAPSSARTASSGTREFHDDPSRRAARAARALPRRERRLARVADGPLDRPARPRRTTGGPTRASASWCSSLVAVVAGVVWYRIGVGGASDGRVGRAARAVTHHACRPRRSTTPTPSTAADGHAGARSWCTSPARSTHPGVVELARGRPGDRRGRGGRRRAGRRRPRPAEPRGQGHRRRAGLRARRSAQADPGVGDRRRPAPARRDGRGTGGDAGAKVNLNTATQAQLEALPGHRAHATRRRSSPSAQRRGGFTSVNELRSVRGIGDKRFAELAPLVTV